jgi:hypothetical protein
MKSPFTSFAVALALLVVAFAGYAVLRTTVNAKSIEVADLSRKIQAKTVEAGRIASVRERLSALADDEAAVERYFVPETGIVGFIDGLQARGKTLGATVDISSVAAQPATKTSRPLLLISLSVTGAFDAVMRTVGSIEYAPYDLRITNFNLTHGSEAWVANASLAVGSAEGDTAQTPPMPEAPEAVASTTPVVATSTATSTP